MFSGNFKGGRRLAVVLSIAAAALTACGGEDGLLDDPNGPFVSWQNNANGTVILDSNNDRYAVRVSDRAVVSMQDNKALTGLTVNSNADLLDSGVKVGGVFPGTSTSGSTIAVFKCTNGRSLNISETSTTYNYSCV